MKHRHCTAGVCATVLTLAATAPIFGQSAPAAAASEEEVVVLSPFVVSANEGATGYGVKDTLAGTRVRTELKDIASSISVINSQFLKDTGARNNQDLLVYTTNTEVAGTSGNYSGLGSFISGTYQTSFANPSAETRVRGVDSADNTRDYFTSDIPWDSYNVDRVDLQRGPNSILFGVGSPAGIVNTSTNGASFKTGGKLGNRFGSYGSFRDSLDYNQVLLKDQLAVRVSLLDDDTKYRQKPAYNRDRRFYAALRFDPEFLNKDWGHTSIKANFEYGKVRANRPRYTPPEDRISQYFYSDDGNATNGLEIDGQSYDSLYIWQSGIAGVTGSTNVYGGVQNYWITQYKGPGMQTTNNAVATYVSPASSTAATYAQALPYGDATTIAGSSLGYPYFATMGIAGYAEYADYANLAGSDTNVWKSYSLTDGSVYDFYNKLIDGNNKKEWQDWHSLNVALEQTFLNNRLAFQLVYDRQDYTEGQERNINNPYISVDINEYVGTSPIWDSTATKNAYAGYAFVGSGTRDSGGSSRDTLRESIRATVTGELRAEDFLEKKSLLARILGRHVFTGLYDNNTTTTRNLSWARYALGTDYTTAIGNTTKSKLTDGVRVLDWITYLGYVGDASSSANLNLSNVSATQSPSGTVSVRYWNPSWTSTEDPNSKTWLNPYAKFDTVTGTWTSETQLQNANPNNYAGWTTGNFTILNADEGDRDLLYTSASKLRTKIESNAFTWQGYFFDDILVPTWGFRRDKVTNDSGYGTTDATTGSVMDYDSIGYNDDYRDTTTANSVSWGVVLHLPKALRGKLPWGTDLSLHYDHGQNTRSEIRYGFSGNRLPNASGKTEEYGFTLSTLHDKLQFKTTWYETTVKNANMASTTGQNGTLGSNTYYLYLLPAWGTAHALIARAGLAGELTTYATDGTVASNARNNVWDWQWASDWSTHDPLSASYKALATVQAEQAAVDDWFANMDMGQTYWDAYGLSISSSAWQSKDWSNVVGDGWNVLTGSIGGIQASGSGRIRGTYPIGTCDTRSTGVEMELTAQPIKGLSLSFNASRTFASQTALSTEFISTIQDMYNRLYGNESKAGDMRLWWAGDTTTVGQMFLKSIWAPYLFQVQTNGKMVSEMSPWRFNAIANYSFDETFFNGRLKGVNVGGGYRWQKAPVIGYLITDSTDAEWIRKNLTTSSSLDINLPVYGESESHVDLWVGYSRPLTAKINWNIQLNLKNLGEKAHLKPISVQPLLNSDGSIDYANYRICDGMTWTITNTFTF